MTMSLAWQLSVPGSNGGMRFLVSVTVLLLFRPTPAEHPPWLATSSGCQSAVCCEFGAACTVSRPSESAKKCVYPTRFYDNRITTINCLHSATCARIDVKNLQRDIESLTIEKCDVAVAVETFTYGLAVIVENKEFVSKNFLFVIKPSLTPEKPAWQEWPALSKIVVNGANLRRVPVALLRAAAKSLRHLELVNNKLLIINAMDFISLIQLGSLEYLNLDNNSIVDFGQDYVNNILNHIKFTLFRKLDSVTRRLFHSKRHQTQMNHIFCRAFGACLDDPHLISIATILKHNYHIRSLGFKFVVLFRYAYQNLRILHLNRNKLSRIPEAIFAMNYLEELHLADNAIAKEGFTKSKETVFKMLKKLKVLNLEGNVIDVLSSQALLYLTALQKLYIGRNRLSRLPTDVFRTLERLYHLDVSVNFLTDLHLDPPLVALRVLNISANNFINIDSDMMQAFPNLEVLDASNNPLKAVGIGAFAQLQRLRSIDLRGNKMITLPSISFRMAPQRNPGKRVRLWLFDEQALLHPPRLKCDCDSLLLAIGKENNDLEFLTKVSQGFKFPIIEPPSSNTRPVCSNMKNQLLSFSESIEAGGRGDICSIKDIDCPPNCPCCSYKMAFCGCAAFKCPIDCSCFRSHLWNNVTVVCDHIRMQTIPTTFSPQSEKHLKEYPLVTKLSIYDANLLLIEAQYPCPKGLQAIAKLNIKRSNVHQLHTESFRCFKSIRSLCLIDNPLKDLPKALFSTTNAHLASVNFSSNKISMVTADTFASLPNLVSLDLSNNPFLCDCNWEVSFWSWATNARRQGLYLVLPEFCKPSQELLRFGVPKGRRHAPLEFSVRRIKAACDLMHRNQYDMQHRRELILATVCPITAILLLGSILLFVYCRYRYALWIKIDTSVPWEPIRKLLGLQLSQEKTIDVALLFHECQMREQHEMNNFITVQGRNLHVESIAYYMPGACVFDQFSTLIDEAAVCFVYMTNEFLNDTKYMGPIHEIFEDRYRLETLRLVPIYPADGSSANHERMPRLQKILRRHNGLVWGSSHFWERVCLALPPRRELSPDANAMGIRWSSVTNRNQKTADVCVIAHETQLHLVRIIFERYNRSFSMIHYRHGAIYNCSEVPAEKRPQSLLQLCLWCRQIVVVLSPSLLEDLVEMTNLARDLSHRLECLKFPGSLILIDADIGLLAFNAPERSKWAELLQTFASSIAHVSADALIREDWTGVDRVLCGLTDDPLQGEAIDSVQFDRQLRQGSFAIDTGPQAESRFEVNRLGWEETLDDQEDVPLLSSV